MRYPKSALSLEEQVDLLIARGLAVPDHAKAIRFLSHISYYRLRAYWLPLENGGGGNPHSFRPGATFDGVLGLYLFDRELRLLLLDLIERFEVSVRARLAQALAMRYGPHAHLGAELFVGPSEHSECLKSLAEEVDRSHEVFIKHYRDTYTDPALPPLWASCEVMSFGLLSKLIKSLRHRADRQSVAETYGLDERVFCSFLHHLCNVRNLCAHHSRIWNRRFTITMKLPKWPADFAKRFNDEAGRNLFNTLVMLDQVIAIVSPGSDWQKRLLALIDSCPGADPVAMGFPEAWRTRSFLAEQNQEVVGREAQDGKHDLGPG